MNKQKNRDIIRVLAIDIGNSTLSYGFFQSKKLVKTGFFSIVDIRNYIIPKLFNNIIENGANSNSLQVIISSVVPEITKKVIALIKKSDQLISVYVIGQNVCLSVPMKYNRKNIGADRIVNIYGGLKLYRQPFLMIDFGTAITFDYVSKKGVFEGGLIVPGVHLSFNALKNQAALIPDFKQLQAVRSLIGHDTKAALSSGLLNGFGALADGLISRFHSWYGKMTVIGTGGFVTKIKPYVTGFDIIDPLHTIRSLEIIYQNEVSKKEEIL